MILGQGHDIPFGNGQQLCEILSRSNLAVSSYGPDTDFQYVCTVTLTSEIWPWVKVMTHPWVMDNNCVKYNPDPTTQWGVMARTPISSMCALWPRPWRYDLGSRSWHILGSWTTIVWNIIQIGQGSTKFMARTGSEQMDRETHGQTQTDGQTDRVIPIYPPPNFVCGGIMKVVGIWHFNYLKCINWCLILITIRICSVMLLYKLQNVTEKVVLRTNVSSQNSQKGLSYDMSLTLIDNLVMWSFYPYENIRRIPPSL